MRMGPTPRGMQNSGMNREVVITTSRAHEPNLKAAGIVHRCSAPWHAARHAPTQTSTWRRR
jgi:hypothetical protein